MKQAVFALLLLAACSGSSNRSALFIDNPAEGLSPSPAGIQPLGVTLDWLKTKTDSPRYTLTGNDF
ncbi:MAG: hypothetical protein LBH41_00225 [Rickettsiales bacterium]|nr:hypothetical protein [Rickettsiales bacterium]